MTPQELKASILQLAIQGKLVPQIPEEGTGEELFQEIQAEKQRLIKTGKIKKEKSLPEITEDEIQFDIPESWRHVRLGEVFCLEMGQSPDGNTVSEIGNGIEFHQGKVHFGKMELQLSPQKTTAPTKYAEPESVLLCVRAPVGKVNITKRQICIGRGLCAVKPICGVSVEFVYYWLATMEKTFVKKATGTTFVAITGDVVKNQVIPLPPLAEQKRIVAKIEELLPYIDRYDQAWSKLEEFNKRFPVDMQKSILQMAIQGKLVEQRAEEGTGEELYQQIQEEKQRLIKAGTIKKEKSLPEIAEDDIPFDIPETWKWVRFDNLCAVLTCGYASTPTYVSENDGMPFISAKNVKPYRFMPEDHNYISYELYNKLTQNAKPEKGDILLTRVGAGIGEAAIIDTDLDFAIYVSLTLIKLVSNNLLDNQYILYWLNSPIGVSSAKKNIYGKNASQGNLNVKNVRDFLVPLPPLAEQKRIVTKLEEILPLCERLK